MLTTARSRIHELTISLRFLGIILGVLRLEVSVYNVYITNQFQTTFAQGGGGVWEGGGLNQLVEVTVNSKEENSSDFCPNYVLEFGLRSESFNAGNFYYRMVSASLVK
jgi:hypothetical protein